MILKVALIVYIWFLFLLGFLDSLNVDMIFSWYSLEFTFTGDGKCSKSLIWWSVLTRCMRMNLVSNQILMMIWTSDRVWENLRILGLLSRWLITLLSCILMIANKLPVHKLILLFNKTCRRILRIIKIPNFIRTMIIMVNNDMFRKVLTVDNVILTIIVLFF